MSASFEATVLGGTAGLGTALMWAVSTALWRRSVDRYSSMGLNLFKCAVGGACLLILSAAGNGPRSLAVIFSRDGLMLTVSGILGLALGDICFFATMKRLGAQPASVMNQLTPLWMVLIGLLAASESLSARQYVAIPLIALGVVLVIFGRRVENPRTEARLNGSGILFGVAASLLTAVGFLIANPPVERVGALMGSSVRVASAAVALSLASWSVDRTGFAPLLHIRSNRRELCAVMLGTVGGVTGSLYAQAKIEPSIAISLCSTSPVFLLPIAIVFLGERYNWIAWIGTLFTIVGVPLLLIPG